MDRDRGGSRRGITLVVGAAHLRVHVRVSQDDDEKGVWLDLDPLLRSHMVVGARRQRSAFVDFSTHTP